VDLQNLKIKENKQHNTTQKEQLLPTTTITVFFFVVMKYLLAIILCITCYGASAQQNWYIPSDTTAKFKYAVYNQNGQIISYSIARVDSVYKAGNRWIVRQSSTLYNARMQPTGAVLYAESYVSNDTTYLAINRTMNMSGATVHTKGILIALPATIDGQTTFANQQLNCRINFAGMNFRTTTEVYDIQIMNQETLTVDNRIFNTLKISYNTSTRVLGRREQTFVTTWIAKEMGIMLAVVNNEQNGNSTTTKLISIE